MMEQSFVVTLNITLIFQTALVFYFFGKHEKIPYSAREIFFVVANAGCLFLAAGLIKNNSLLIKGGIYILVVQALIDAAVAKALVSVPTPTPTATPPQTASSRRHPSIYGSLPPQH